MGPAANAAPDAEHSASELIDQKIASLNDWRAETLACLRALILAADPRIVEQVKWRKPTNPAGVPVWECAGIICTGETYKDKVKLTFAKGAELDDPTGLFNASLEGGKTRAIDLAVGDQVDAQSFGQLVTDAIALNTSARRDKGR